MSNLSVLLLLLLTDGMDVFGGAPLTRRGSFGRHVTVP